MPFYFWYRFTTTYQRIQCQHIERGIDGDLSQWPGLLIVIVSCEEQCSQVVLKSMRIRCIPKWKDCVKRRVSIKYDRMKKCSNLHIRLWSRLQIWLDSIRTTRKYTSNIISESITILCVRYHDWQNMIF